MKIKNKEKEMKNCLFDLVCYHCENLDLVEWEDITLYCNICHKKDNQDKNCMRAGVECNECEYFVELSYFEDNRAQCLKKIKREITTPTKK